MKTCPYCGKEYPEGTQVCPADRNVLIPADPTLKAQADDTGPLKARVEFDGRVQGMQERQDFGARLHAATPRAFVTPWLIALNVLVFVLMAFAGAGVWPMGDPGEAKYVALNPEVHIQWGANFGPLTTDGQWWRLLTSTFLHFGILHLALNMWALYAAGLLVERLYGKAFFLFLYLAAGIIGSVASVWWNPKVLSAGASGALFGVYGGLLAYLLLQRGSVPGTMMAQLRSSFLTCVAYNLIWGFSHPGIDNAAHLGGLAGGTVMGLVLSRPLDLEERRRPTWIRWGAGACMAVVLSSLLWRQVPNSGEPYRQEQRFRADVKWFTEEEQVILSSWKEGQRDAAAKKPDAVVVTKFRPLIARWEQAQERLASAHLESDTPLSRRQQLLLEYIGFRRDAMKALVEALDANDQSKLNRFKALESRAQATLEELKSVK